MCNDYRYREPIERLIDEFSHNKIKLRFPGGIPNIEPKDDIKIRDRAPIVQTDEEGPRLDMMTWAWKGPTGKPVFNFQSDNRKFPVGRCLIPADGFYEFTTPKDPKKKLKDKWLFTMEDYPIFCIAGIVKQDAWSMLTCPPGPDIAPFHDRQIVLLRPDQWASWLSCEPNERELLTAPPAGSLSIVQVG